MKIILMFMNGPFLHKFPFADYFKMFNRVSQH